MNKRPAELHAGEIPVNAQDFAGYYGDAHGAGDSSANLPRWLGIVGLHIKEFSPAGYRRNPAHREDG